MKKLIVFYFLNIFTSLSASVIPPMIPVKTDTLLIKSIKSGDRKTIKNLLKNRLVRINELGIDQKTAMDVAVEFGDAKTAILLSRYGGKMTRSDNVAEFKSMLSYRAKRFLISFIVMFLLAPTACYLFSFSVILAEEVSKAYLALAIPIGIGVFFYGAYEWYSLFKAISMCSEVEKCWMIQVPDIA